MPKDGRSDAESSISSRSEDRADGPRRTADTGRCSFKREHPIEREDVVLDPIRREIRVLDRRDTVSAITAARPPQGPPFAATASSRGPPPRSAATEFDASPEPCLEGPPVQPEDRAERRVLQRRVPRGKSAYLALIAPNTCFAQPCRIHAIHDARCPACALAYGSRPCPSSRKRAPAACLRFAHDGVLRSPPRERPPPSSISATPRSSRS